MSPGRSPVRAAILAGMGSTARPRTIVAWSSGKDSAYALHVLRQAGELDIVALFTTLSREDDRVAMHAVRRDLVRAQGERASLPLWEVAIPSPCSTAEYDAAMRGLVDRALEAGVEAVAFGDLYLEDVRRYREERLAGTGLRPVFPLWGIPTSELAGRMLDSGLQAILTTVDLRKLPAELAGRHWNRDLISRLPVGADPCGENGEFHTFVSAGPMLSSPIGIEVGPPVERDGFAYADLKPGSP
jgi:uncharacterized protein (TIGR00290 family)